LDVKTGLTSQLLQIRNPMLDPLADRLLDEAIRERLGT